MERIPYSTRITPGTKKEIERFCHLWGCKEYQAVERLLSLAITALSNNQKPVYKWTTPKRN